MGRQIRYESPKLVTVAAAEHSVDALHALFNAQAALADRPREEARGLVSLPVGCKHRGYGASRPRGDPHGSSSGAAPAQTGPGPVRTPASGSYEEGNDQERKDQLQRWCQGWLAYSGYPLLGIGSSCQCCVETIVSTVPSIGKTVLRDQGVAAVEIARLDPDEKLIRVEPGLWSPRAEAEPELVGVTGAPLALSSRDLVHRHCDLRPYSLCSGGP